MNKKGIKKYQAGAATVPTTFSDKAGAFMKENGGAMTSAAGSLMPLLMKKPDPNSKPYMKGSKLIKYQAGTNNAATDDPEDLHAYFGRILGKNKTVQPSNELQGEVGPTRKEAADLMRTYNKANKNNPNVIGKVDEEEITKREKELKNLTSSNKTKLPITYNNPSAGPSKEELETGRNKEISENAEKARKNYETRLDAEAARTQYEKKQAIEGEKNMVGPSREDLIKYKKEAEATEAAIKSGIPSSLTAPTFTKESVQRAIEKKAGGPVSTEKNPILYKESVKEKNPYISFKQMSAADQKKYRAGMASGAKFEVGGREYAAAKPEEMAFSARMASKKNKSNLSKRSSIDDILDKYDRTKPGSIAYEKIKNTKPESLTDITRKQILTPNKILQQEEKSKKDFDYKLEQARLKAAKATKPGEMGDPKNPDVKAYRELLKQKPLTKFETQEIQKIKDSVSPSSLALTTAGLVTAGSANGIINQSKNISQTLQRAKGLKGLNTNPLQETAENLGNFVKKTKWKSRNPLQAI